MIDNSLEELFETIENSLEYKEYRQMEDILSQDRELMNLINDIKKLEKEATYLENKRDKMYLKKDELIKEKLAKLNGNHVYQEYLNKLDELNNELAVSSKMIEKYVEEKV